MTNRLSIFSNLILVLQVFLVLLCFADLSSLPSPVLFAGRLHPLILHLPITLILLLLPISLYAANRKEQKKIAAFFQLLLHGIALISTLTAITGFFLAAGGSYDADSLFSATTEKLFWRINLKPKKYILLPPLQHLRLKN